MDNIRHTLNTLSLIDLKRLVRSHNLHYYIKLSSPRDVLIQKLLSFYNSINGDFTKAMPKPNQQDTTIQPRPPKRPRQPKRPKVMLEEAVEPQAVEKIDEDRLKHASKLQPNLLEKIQNTILTLKPTPAKKLAKLSKALIKRRAIEDNIIQEEPNSQPILDIQNDLKKLLKHNEEIYQLAITKSTNIFELLSFLLQRSKSACNLLVSTINNNPGIHDERYKKDKATYAAYLYLRKKYSKNPEFQMTSTQRINLSKLEREVYTCFSNQKFRITRPKNPEYIIQQKEDFISDMNKIESKHDKTKIYRKGILIETAELIHKVIRFRDSKDPEKLKLVELFKNNNNPLFKKRVNQAKKRFNLEIEKQEPI